MEVSIKFVCLFVCQKPPGPVCRSRKSDIDKSDIDNDIEVSPRRRSCTLVFIQFSTFFPQLVAFFPILLTFFPDPF